MTMRYGLKKPGATEHIRSLKAGDAICWDPITTGVSIIDKAGAILEWHYDNVMGQDGLVITQGITTYNQFLIIVRVLTVTHGLEVNEEEKGLVFRFTKEHTSDTNRVFLG